MSRERKDQSLFRGHNQPPLDGAAHGAAAPCLEPAVFWKAALANGIESFTAEERRHLNQCPICQKRFEQVLKAVEGALPPGDDTDVPENYVEPPTEQTIVRLETSQHIAPLRFFNNGFVAQLLRDPTGDHWLKISHPRKLPLVMLKVVIQGTGFKKPWQRFVLLVPQKDNSEAQVCIEDTIPIPGREYTLLIDALEDGIPLMGDLPVWRSSFARVRREVPETLSAWRSWVESLPIEAAEPEVRQFLGKVRRGEIDKQEVIVCSQGHGHFLALSEAIREAETGTRILVRPGLYLEEIVLDRQLEIIGDVGRREFIVVEGRRGPALTVNTSRGKIKGITFRGGREAAVVVHRGEVVFEDCAASGGSLATVCVTGSSSAPLWLRSRFHHGRSAGLLFQNRARGRIEDCELFANGWSGIEVVLGAKLSVVRCHIHDNGRFGILVSDGGNVIVEDSLQSKHPGSDVAVCYEGVATLTRCLLGEGRGHGVQVHDEGKAALVKCTLVNHREPSLDVGDGCRLTVDRSRITGKRGVSLFREGQAEVNISDTQGIVEEETCPIR